MLVESIKVDELVNKLKASSYQKSEDIKQKSAFWADFCQNILTWVTYSGGIRES